MSRIEELTRELCPDGVHVRTLDAVITALRTGLNPRQNFKLNAPGATHHYITVRELGGFEIRPTEKTDLVDDEGLSRIQARSKLKIGDVLFSGTGTIGRTALVAEEPTTWNIKEGVYTITPDPAAIDARYLVYVLHSTSVRSKILAAADGSTVASVPMATLRNIRIPVPPLEVQRAIVEVLDKFTQLEAELEAELEARKQQYEHYRNDIFRHEVVRDSWVTLSDLVDVRDGTHDSPSRTLDGYPLVTSKNITGGFVDLSTAYLVSEQDYIEVNRRSQVDRWNVLFSMIGTVGEVAVVETEPSFAIKNVGLIKTEDELSARFIAFYLQTDFAKRYISAAQSGTAQKYLGLGKLRAFPIPRVTQERKARIVNLLDKFDALVNDLSVGVPAELNARRQQYEYYRDKLLTFKELEVSV